VLDKHLESIFAEELDDHLSQLAHHYRHSDNLIKAVEYLGRAGQQALQRSAHVDAISSLRAAIDLLQRLPDGPERIQRELPLQLALGSASIAIHGYAAPEVEQAFTRARELCEQLGDPPELFPALFGLFALFYLRGELSIACALAEQLMQRAHDAHDPTLLLMAHMALGDTSQSSGKPLIAIEHCESALSLYDPERHRQIFFGGDARINPLSYAGASLWYLGYPD
jgi:predicted ATPase